MGGQYDVVMEADGRALGKSDLLMLIVANARIFGGGFRVAPHADVEDGKLEAVVFGNMGFGGRVSALVRLLQDKGVQLEYPLEQSCCGLPAKMTGENETAREVAMQNLRAIDPADYAPQESAEQQTPIIRPVALRATQSGCASATRLFGPMRSASIHKPQSMPWAWTRSRNGFRPPGKRCRSTSALLPAGR